MTTHDALAEYGFALSDSQTIVTPSGKDTRATVTPKGKRVQVRTQSGTLLWSGAPGALGDFLSAFWFARKLAA